MQRNAVPSAPATREGSPDDLWRSLPASPLHRQKKLTGWRDLDEHGDEDATIESRGLQVETDRYAQLTARLADAGWDFHTVMLGAYHLVLQWYVDDFESLIGSCLVSPDGLDAPPGGGRTVTVSPSYVYAEDDDPVEQVLRDVAQQCRGAEAMARDREVAT
jgi:hypothetical protein